MRYGPCGKIVDWGRNAYKTTCRFWEDSSETSTIRWVEALPDAPTIGQWSAIGMSIWDRFPPPEGVGEVDGAYKQFTGQVAPAGLDGNHVCATPHEIEFGGKYLPDDPPAEYDELGYLKCCKVPPPVPPPIVPGPTCELAANGELEVEYTYPIDSGGPEQWWIFDLPLGTFWLEGSQTGTARTVFVNSYPPTATCGSLGAYVSTWLTGVNVFYGPRRLYFFLSYNAAPAQVTYTMKMHQVS